MTRLDLSTDTYTDAQVLTQLQTSGRELRFQYELLNSSYQSKGFLEGVATGSTISHDHTSDGVKRTAKFTIVEALGDDINYASDMIRPWIGVRMPDGGFADYPKGLFLLGSSTRTVEDGLIQRQVDGYDLAQVLMDDKVLDRYVVAQGTQYTDAISALLSQFQNPQVTESDSTVSADRTWDPGTSKYAIVADLLDGLGYAPLVFDDYGQPVCEPYVAPANDESSFTYVTDDLSVIQDGAQQTLDLFGVPNVFKRVINVGNKALLTSTFRNTNPSSPSSTVSRGRQITDFAEANDAADQAALDAIVAKAAAEAAQVYDTVDLPTMLMPFHGDRDIVTVQHLQLGISQDYAESGWEMTLAAGSTMTHALSTVVAATDDGSGDDA